MPKTLNQQVALGVVSKIKELYWQIIGGDASVETRTKLLDLAESHPREVEHLELGPQIGRIRSKHGSEVK